MNSEKHPVWKYYVLPFLIQFGVLGVCIPLHRIFIRIGPSLGIPEMIGMELTDPTAGRLAYAVLSAVAFVVLTLLASKKAVNGGVYAPFVLGMFAGTFLWQSIGEDLWHFSVAGVHFVSPESIAVLPLVILFCLAMVYFRKRGALDWGVWCAVLAFAVNWLGHYVLLGIYPLVGGMFEINAWCRGVGIALGCTLLAVSLLLGPRKEKAPKERMLLAILGYYAVAVLAFGMVGI